MGPFTPGHLRRKRLLTAQLLHSCLGQVCPVKHSDVLPVLAYACDGKSIWCRAVPWGASAQHGAGQLCEPGKLPQLSPWPCWAAMATWHLGCNLPIASTPTMVLLPWGCTEQTSLVQSSPSLQYSPQPALSLSGVYCCNTRGLSAA